MRRPTRARNVSAGIAALGFTAVAAALAAGPDMGRMAREATWIVGGILAVAALAVAAYAQVFVSRRDRLLRGDGVLARWPVGVRDWRAFVAMNEELNRDEPGVAWHDRGGEGVEVVIGRDGILVGDDYVVLRLGSFYELSSAECVDGRVELRITGHGESASRTTLVRVPVPAGKEQEATAACRALDADAPG